MLNTGPDPTVWIAFSAGLLSFFSPCVLPLIPSYLTYITGLSFGELEQSRPGVKIRLSVLLHSLSFIVGFSAIFIVLGLLTALASATFQESVNQGMVWLQRGGGLLVFLFGLHMSGLVRFSLLLREKRWHVRNKPSGYAGTFLVGVAFAAGWSPCIGSILGAILAIAAGNAGSSVHAALLLSFYSAGLALPFLLSGSLFNVFVNFASRFKKHIGLVEKTTSILLMTLGCLMFFDQFKILSGLAYAYF